MRTIPLVLLLYLFGCESADPPPSEECRAEGDPCSSGYTCEFGTETCRGETHPSFSCRCVAGEVQCHATDACINALDGGGRDE